MKRIFWLFISFLTVAGWINNIVWLLEHWNHITILNKLLHLFSIFVIPPIGAIVGYLHFFRLI